MQQVRTRRPCLTCCNNGWCWWSLVTCELRLTAYRRPGVRNGSRPTPCLGRPRREALDPQGKATRFDEASCEVRGPVPIGHSLLGVLRLLYFAAVLLTCHRLARLRHMRRTLALGQLVSGVVLGNLERGPVGHVGGLLRPTMATSVCPCRTRTRPRDRSALTASTKDPPSIAKRPHQGPHPRNLLL
jgi:hypothetical protein